MANWDTNWEKIFKNKVWGRYPHDVLVGFVARNFYKVENRSQIKVLEVGCGSGNNIWYLSREGFDAYGIDASITAIDQAKNYLSENGEVANLSVGDVSKLEFSDNFFDLVIDFGCLGSNDEPHAKKILSECKRVLKKGGLYFNEAVGEDTNMGTYEKKRENTYYNLTEGAFEGLGLIRTISPNIINKLYGQFFEIISVDVINSSVNNGQISIQKYITIGKKE